MHRILMLHVSIQAKSHTELMRQGLVAASHQEKALSQEAYQTWARQAMKPASVLELSATHTLVPKGRPASLMMPSSRPTFSNAMPRFCTRQLRYVFIGETMKILLSAQQTGGQFSLIEGIMPPGGDGGLHVRRREDESMVMLEGELKVTNGDSVFPLTEGQSYIAPRDVPQRLRNRGNVAARALLVTTPGGFDEFIVKAGTPICDAIGNGLPTTLQPYQLAALSALTEEYGVEILLPPGVGVPS